jgi:hypothetical protein
MNPYKIKVLSRSILDAKIHKFFLPTFPLMEKSAKDQADGKCNRTSPLPPTVGMAPTRSVRALLYGNNQFPFS